MPLPEAALLRPQPPPNCEYRGGKSGDAPAHAQTADAKPADIGEEMRVKLDYERQCYRHAEIIARSRLRKLQEQVSETMRAIEVHRASLGPGHPPAPGP